MITRKSIELFLEAALDDVTKENPKLKKVKYKFSKALSPKSRKPKSVDIKIYFND